jgi:branched-chain amino acid transport system permease protein
MSERTASERTSPVAGLAGAANGTAPASAYTAALIDAAQWGFVALLLAVPLLAWRTTETQTALDLVSRWPIVAEAAVTVIAVRLVLLLGVLSEARGEAHRDLLMRHVFGAAAVAFAGVGAADLAASYVYGGVLAGWWRFRIALALWLVFLVVFQRARIGLAFSALDRIAGNAALATALPALGLGLMAVFPFLPFSDRYVMDLAVMVLTYVMLGWGLNVVVGLAGLLDLGYVAFYAVGAYAYALLAQNFGLSFWICLPLAGILAAFWGIILGFPVLRLRGDYLAIVTLAFGEIIRIVLLNWQSLTGGPNGISGIPRPSFFGLTFDPSCGAGSFCGFFGIEHSSLHRIVWLYYIICGLALLTAWVTTRVRRLPVGRAWEALREDEIACRALGLNTTLVKLSAFAMGAMFGGFAGSFFATKQGFISPESFTFMESATILAMVVMGGMGSQMGVAVAALVMVGGVELFRDLEIYRMLVFGMAMVAMMIWRPRGFVGSRTPTIALQEGTRISSSLVKEGHG